jgi:hypothetical protein
VRLRAKEEEVRQLRLQNKHIEEETIQLRLSNRAKEEEIERSRLENKLMESEIADKNLKLREKSLEVRKSEFDFLETVIDVIVAKCKEPVEKDIECFKNKMLKFMDVDDGDDSR